MVGACPNGFHSHSSQPCECRLETVRPVDKLITLNLAHLWCTELLDGAMEDEHEDVGQTEDVLIMDGKAYSVPGDQSTDKQDGRRREARKEACQEADVTGKLTFVSPSSPFPIFFHISGSSIFRGFLGPNWIIMAYLWLSY